MHYLERRPPPALAPFIKSFWYAFDPSATHRHERILPNGHPQIVISLPRDYLTDATPPTDPLHPPPPSRGVPPPSSWAFSPTPSRSKPSPSATSSDSSSPPAAPAPSSLKTLS